jgi:predicted CXXCH cytochrome family protein
MWVKGILDLQKKVNELCSRRSHITSIFFTIVIFILMVSMLTVFMGQFQGYSPVANKCISCHNDTGYPNDTNGDGVAAPYKRPHNNSVMCESCHRSNPHTLVYIQASGEYGSKSTAASCPECHQTGIPSGVNSNFTTAFKISSPLRHSSDLSNGSVWGSYWINSTPRTACIFCHNKTLHDIAPLGRILGWYPDYKLNSSIGSNFICAGCHFKGSPNYSSMSYSLATAGLQIPPEITNGSNWNGTSTNYYNHTISNYTDETCKHCHGLSLDANVTMAEFIHNLTVADMNACIECHPEVNSSSLGKHANFTGTSAVESSDCKTCHYRSFPMVKGAVNNSNTYFCADCHTAAGTGPNKSSIIFTDKKHGENSCMDCHVADGKYHQGNPRGSVANSTYVNRYPTSNTLTTDCSDCHYAANLDDAPFNAPGGGQHIVNNGAACPTGGCHAGGTNMIQTIHNVGAMNTSLTPSISIPALSSSSVIQGTDVNLSATVIFTTTFAFVDGAQYRILSGATEIRSWTPMSAADGDFNGATEVAIATIKTNISAGNYTIQVRGMAGGPAQNTSIRYYPMNGDVSAINSANLTILAPMGYINGTVTDGVSPLTGATVSITGASSTTNSGLYSLMVVEGTYNVTASKRPEYYDNTTSGVAVITGNTTIQDFVITLKPTGNIKGTVTNAT